MRIFAVFRSQQDLYCSYNIVSFIVQTIIYVISEGIFSSTKDFHYTRLNTENMPRFLEAYFPDNRRENGVSRVKGGV